MFMFKDPLKVRHYKETQSHDGTEGRYGLLVATSFSFTEEVTYV